MLIGQTKTQVCETGSANLYSLLLAVGQEERHVCDSKSPKRFEGQRGTQAVLELSPKVKG